MSTRTASRLMFDIKRQPELYFWRAAGASLPTGGWGLTRRSGGPAQKNPCSKNIFRQTSTKTVSGLMFDIKRQPKLYLVDI